jgi:hypothetical protein
VGVFTMVTRGFVTETVGTKEVTAAEISLDESCSDRTESTETTESEEISEEGTHEIYGEIVGVMDISGVTE